MFKFVFYKTSFLHPHKHMKQTHTPSHPRNKLGEDSTLIQTEQHALCTTEENLLAFWSEWRIGRKEEERERERERPTGWGGFGRIQSCVVSYTFRIPSVVQLLFVHYSSCSFCSLLKLLFLFYCYITCLLRSLFLLILAIFQMFSFV